MLGIHDSRWKGGRNYKISPMGLFPPQNGHSGSSWSCLAGRRRPKIASICNWHLKGLNVRVLNKNLFSKSFLKLYFLQPYTDCRKQGGCRQIFSRRARQNIWDSWELRNNPQLRTSTTCMWWQIIKQLQGFLQFWQLICCFIDQIFGEK